jgi:hypothetical protein
LSKLNPFQAQIVVLAVLDLLEEKVNARRR